MFQRKKGAKIDEEEQNGVIVTSINYLLGYYQSKNYIIIIQGVASAKDIDTTMKLGTNMPMGPLTLADFIGLDTCLAIQKVLHENTGDSKYRPSVLLQKYVEAGWYGKKSGRGFYSYNKQSYFVIIIVIIKREKYVLFIILSLPCMIEGSFCCSASFLVKPIFYDNIFS